MSITTTDRLGRAGELALKACLFEVLAPKAGNVHPAAAFDDATWLDFALSASVTAPILDQAAQAGVGETVLACVRATHEVAAGNTNLGMLLLLAPLCAACGGDDLAASTKRVLAGLTSTDCHAVYEAIRLANPGGLGQSPEADVHHDPPADLVAAMRLAADRDAVARQYATGFADVFERLAPSLGRHVNAGLSFDQAIVVVHVEQMAHEPESLIRRKCGDAIAREAQQRAAKVLAAGDPNLAPWRKAVKSLDRWLRADGHRRNPGTAADLVAAAIFVALHDRLVPDPPAWTVPLPEAG